MQIRTGPALDALDRQGFRQAVSEGKPVRYRDAGVDIDGADRLVKRISELAGRTRIPGVMAGVGGFASLFSLKDAFQTPMEDPVLVAGTDGVGTKLKVAFAAQRHGTIGIDLVAMCVNDVVTTGATPLFFLDYFGTGRLEPEVAAAVVEGIAEGCHQAGCALIGGETAELPGLYADAEYDLAGFAVGVVDRPRIVDGRSCAAGDVLVGIESRGLHSNGYSLARRVLLPNAGAAHAPLSDRDPRTRADVLLAPTPIYAPLVSTWMARFRPKALAHITGGGLPGNLPRVLPQGLAARVDPGSWPVPEVFRVIADEGPVEEDEMFRTFNMGIGMVAVVDPADAEEAIEGARAVGQTARVIGQLESGEGPVGWSPP
jgi:phosphoribosylformylglycinamidine cyclo-ligase